MMMINTHTHTRQYTPQKKAKNFLFFSHFFSAIVVTVDFLFVSLALEREFPAIPE